MSSHKLTTPVLLMAFNRPDLTQKVFEAIREAKPAKLFFAVDGPRNNRPGEKELVQSTRDILKQVDWDCEVYKLFPEKNAGIQGIHSGPTVAIGWFFQHVAEGIIFEDDCLPHPSFFQYCQEMLAKYRDNEKIMHISGDNFQFGKRRGDASYYFSIYPNSWGWATWRRAWEKFDPLLTTFPEFKDRNKIANIISKKDEQKVWLDTFRKEYYGEWKTWDYEWVYAIWSHGGLSVIPNVNLISNIGFGENATHTLSKTSRLANIPALEMVFPLVHPTVLLPNKEADKYLFKLLFRSRIKWKKVCKKVFFKVTPRWAKDFGKKLLGYPTVNK